MKSIKHLFVVILLLVSTPSQAQILTIVEKANKKNLIIPENSAQIVDINGSLEIQISKAELIKQIRSDYPQFSSQIDLQSSIIALEQALVHQDSILSFLKQKTLNHIDKQIFYNQLDSFYNFLLAPSNENLRAEANSLFEEWWINYGPGSPNSNLGISKEYYLITNFNRSLIEAKEELGKAEGQSFNISMVAYLKNKQGYDRVHIRNFDSYSEREIYTVPRWITNLPRGQTEKLKELQKKVDNYNKEAPNYFENFKMEFVEKFPDLTCITNSKNLIEGFLKDSTIVDDLTEGIRNDMTNLLTDYDNLFKLLDIFKQDVSTWNIATPFEVIEDTKRLIGNVESIESIINNFGNTAEVATGLTAEVNTLVSEVGGCSRNLREVVNMLTQATGILKDQQIRYKNNIEIGKEVLKFSLDDLPAKGYIKLAGAGLRENGDKLEINIIMRIPKGTETENSASEAIREENPILESRTLKLQLIGLRSETVSGIILADSFNEKGFSPTTDRRFFYAPTVSLLLKVGSRKSKVYNDFFDPGFGISVSTPDFDTNGTPEFGPGLMLTAFKDILSLGISYNITLDTPYWYFGINMPFVLPGVPINVPR